MCLVLFSLAILEWLVPRPVSRHLSCQCINIFNGCPHNKLLPEFQNDWCFFLLNIVLKSDHLEEFCVKKGHSMELSLDTHPQFTHKLDVCSMYTFTGWLVSNGGGQTDHSLAIFLQLVCSRVAHQGHPSYEFEFAWQLCRTCSFCKLCQWPLG
jgi:hypothetical protein